MRLLDLLWAGLVAIGAVLAAVFLGRRRAAAPPPLPPDPAIERSRQMREVATARVAVELAIGQEKDRAVRAQLLEVLRAADEDGQVDGLIELGKRVRGEK